MKCDVLASMALPSKYIAWYVTIQYPLKYQSGLLGDLVPIIHARATATRSDGLPVVISKIPVTACTSRSTAHHALVLANLQSDTGLPCQQHNNSTIYSLSYTKDMLCTDALSWGVTSLT
jgi:hypothetical protein